MTKYKELKKYLPLFSLVLPALVYTLIFCYGPMYGLIIAFKDFKPKLGYLGSRWVGLDHFKRFLSYPDFWKMIRNTLSISVYSLLTFPCAIILALLLNEITNVRFKKTVQMVTYAPYFLSTVVMCGLITMMVGRGGMIGQIYQFFTGKSENLLAVPKYFSSIYVWSGVWQSTGWGTIIYMAALAGVPGELVEAARIDGAGQMKIIRHIHI